MRNAERIERVSQALALYDDPNDLRSNIVDLMADLMHIWSQEGSDETFESLLRSADMHFAAEFEEAEKEPQFAVGNIVYWTDPDNGECSGYFKVAEVDEEREELRLVDSSNPSVVTDISAPFGECAWVSGDK